MLSTTELCAPGLSLAVYIVCVFVLNMYHHLFFFNPNFVLFICGVVLEHTYLAMQTYGVSESKPLLFKDVIWIVWNLGGVSVHHFPRLCKHRMYD